MKTIIILIIISLLLCFYNRQKNIENFKPLRTFYNKKHKYFRRKLRPHLRDLKLTWERFSKKIF